MVALTRFALAALLLGAAQPATAACNIGQDGEYTNYDAAGCGDVILRYTQHSTNSPTDIPLGYPVPIPVESVTPVAGFRTYASLFAGQQQMMASHPEVVAGHEVGDTVAGRKIWAYRIGTAAETTIYGQPKGAVMAVGGTHAREWQPPEVVAEIFERLVAGRADGGIGQYLNDNLAVILIPVLNVDGFLLTQKYPESTTGAASVPRDGRMRRKNLNHFDTGVVDDVLTTIDDNLHGVDLNRNHPQGFRSDTRNARTESLIYAGATPHGQPEVEALLEAASLAAGRLRLFMDIHSFTQIYFTPMTGNSARNARTTELASRMRAVTGNKYRYSPDPEGVAIGTAADHFAVAFEVPSWTLETEPLNGGQDYPGGTGASHSGFITPDSEIPRVRDELARTSLLGFYHQAGPPSVVAAEIRDADGALVWSVDWVPGAPGARTLALRTDGALTAGETYTAWIAFDKPMRWRDGAGVVTQYAGQAARLAPLISLEVATSGANQSIALTGGDWLSAPGPGPDGYLNYRDDAYAVEFTLPADLPATATAAVLVVDTDDLAGLKLDGDPATAVDWQGGTWSGYQETTPDCTLRLWVGAVGAAPHSLACTAAAPPPPAPPPPAPAPSGGGRGGFIWLFAMVLFIAAQRRRSYRLARVALSDLRESGFQKVGV